MAEINIQKIQSSKPIKEILEFCIINVDKPAGCTSFDTSEKIRKIFSGRKTGHFGTLDPMVTGVLPIALNRACKLIGYFMHHDKVYIGKFRIHSDINQKELANQMEKFTGKIKQLPPVKSAVKREIRERTINKFEIIKFNKKIIEFIADVEAGTYIRKLISDLGDTIGGAHMTELRRIRAGIFDIKNSYSISDIENAFEKFKKGDETELRRILIPAEIISEILPVVQVKEKNLKQILTGKPIFKKDIASSNFEKLEASKNVNLFVAFLKDRFIGVYRIINEGDVVAKAEFVMN